MAENQSISAPDFIRDLEFSFAETYEFQRGDSYLKSHAANQKLYAQLRARSNRGKLSSSETAQFESLHRLMAFTQYLIDDQGNIHPSAQLTHRTEATSVEMKRLREIMETAIGPKTDWMCAPTYRDAIVFYDSAGKIQSSLNVCLSCERMEIRAEQEVLASDETFRQLRAFFIDLGHEVEG